MFMANMVGEGHYFHGTILAGNFLFGAAVLHQTEWMPLPSDVGHKEKAQSSP